MCVNTTADGMLANWFNAVAEVDERADDRVDVTAGERKDVADMILEITEEISLTPKVVVTEMETPGNFDEVDGVAVVA